MSHRPGQDGAPLHDLTGGGEVYPEDVYTHPHFYGLREDLPVHQMANSYRGQPDRPVTIYRAVPKVVGATAGAQADLDYFQRGMSHLEQHGVLPDHPDYEHWTADEFRSRATKMIPELTDHIAANPPSAVNDINPGDWVTINKDYAKTHGEGIRGGYRILSKTVPASHIRTPGDSIQEWGYFPPKDSNG